MKHVHGYVRRERPGDWAWLVMNNDWVVATGNAWSMKDALRACLEATAVHRGTWRP